MNHLESALTGKNSLWRYIVMIVAVLVVSNTIGALPLLVALFARSMSDPDVFTQLAANPNDYSVLGLDMNMLLIVMLFPFIAGLVAFIFLVKPLNCRTLKTTINGGAKIRWNRFLVSAVIWLILGAIYFFVYMKLDPSNFSLNNTSASLIILSVISILLIPFQAAFEEIIFRGYLMQGFSLLFSYRWFPLLMTSVLFGLMHAFNPEVREFGFLTMMPQYILFGLIFGIITVLDDGIEAAMGAHTANNIFLCIMVTNKASALQTPALYEQISVHPWTEFAALLVTGIIFVLLLAKIFRWRQMSVLFEKIQALPPKEGLIE